jgi:glucan biosynthesis protein
MPKDSPAHELPEGAGFAGFRFQEARAGFPGPKGTPLDWRGNDWVAFLGASYFRAIGELYQYGLSARGLAIDPAVPTGPEEFPDFTHVYLETPAPDAESVVVCALMDSPSVAGAFRFVMTRGSSVTIGVEKSLFIRKDIQRFGIAPLTSMYWYSENKKATAVDWRPEVHDSDGLAIWTGAGERAWRPLNNPPRTIASSFVDNNPRGFGLMQRDRVFGHYLDGVFYEKRPSLWIEPVGAWGKGAVQLIEIPTDDEIHDNIVAMWVPEQPIRAGQRHDYAYTMSWMADEPYPPPLARVVSTRMGNGGQPGTVRPRGVRKFMVEFLGDALGDGHRGHTPRLRATDLRLDPQASLQAHLGNLRRLPGTRLPRHHHDLMRADGRDDVVLALEDRLDDVVGGLLTHAFMNDQDVHHRRLLIVGLHAAVGRFRDHVLDIEVAVFLVHAGNSLGVVDHLDLDAGRCRQISHGRGRQTAHPEEGVDLLVLDRID